MALTKLFSIPKTARLAKACVPVVRGLIDAGLVDGYVTETGHRACPPHAVDQIKTHLAKVSHPNKEEASGR